MEKRLTSAHSLLVLDYCNKPYIPSMVGKKHIQATYANSKFHELNKSAQLYQSDTKQQLQSKSIRPMVSVPSSRVHKTLPNS